MGNAYKYDEDLEFLREIESEDLKELYNVLTKDKDGKTRMTEELTSNDLVKHYYPDHKRYIELIMAELQYFGGNSFANIFRGSGVLYKEILCDVCDKLKVNYNKNAATEVIEMAMFQKILADAVDKMSKEELEEIAKDFNIKNVSSGSVTMALQAVMKMGGFKTYQIIVIIVNSVWKAIFGHGLTLAANATVARYVSIFIGPIGWLITGIWTAVDIAGPAYRVTIPAVIYVAFLRQKLAQKAVENSNVF
ncbi:MAG: DUF3944 domain-containing protein [Helicobacter trogontum]|uniref:DUF3944 domain-containing protein n=1 Tax=Helicobacter trogontum TaxID=50960 RepID=UPI00243127F0|nr:DUF3944 domain-containing protein [Helicobacter trogontum]MCI5787588.1 DUF3944 domain-containing protein [Helicobacter trogontum]